MCSVLNGSAPSVARLPRRCAAGRGLRAAARAGGARSGRLGPIPLIGPCVREIRIDTGLEHRVFYVATFAEAVYVLHAFEKRTRKTPKQDVQLAQDRLRALVVRRRTDASKK